MTTTPTLTKQQQTAVLIATILASSMASIDATALNVALPVLQKDLGVSGSQLLWIANGYALFLSSLLLVGGSLGDIYGRKKVFSIGIVLFTISSMFCGLAESAWFLILGRCIQGLGGALMVPGSLSIISALFPENRRGWAIGTWSMFSAMTTIFGPALGGWLADMGLWRMVFFINVPIAAISLFFLFRHVPETSNDEAGTIDVLGAILATVGLVGLTYGFIEAPEQGFSSPIISSCLIFGSLALIMFLIVEGRSSHAMMPLSLFKSRMFSSTNFLTLLLYGALGGFLFFFPLNLIQIQGYPAKYAGLTVLPLGVTIAILSRMAGGWADKYGVRPLLIAGPAIAGVGFFLLSLPGITDGAGQFFTTFLPGILTIGLGMGITVTPLTTAVMNAVPISHTGVASGVNNTLARTAGVLGVAVLGALVLIRFENSMLLSIEAMDLSQNHTRQLIDQLSNLGATRPPEGLSDGKAIEVSQAVKTAFVSSFNQTARIAAVLALGSALIAFLFVKEDRE